MKNNSSFQWPCCLSVRVSCQWLALACAFLCGAPLAKADINSINQSIWKMHYGVSDAQMADSNWLAADSDGDGLKNSDEIASGTNPFLTGSVVTINSITTDETTVTLTFTTVVLKQYVVQGSPTLTGFNNILVEGAPVTADGMLVKGCEEAPFPGSRPKAYSDRLLSPS